MNKHTFISAALLLPGLALAAYVQSNAGFNAGGGTSTAATYTNIGFVSTMPVGNMSSPNAENTGGFIGSVNPLLTEPVVSLSPGALTFADRVVGSTSPAQTITLTNTGNAALAITGIASTVNVFGVTHACPGSLAASASCNINVTFTPAAIVNRIGAITLSSNAAGSPHSVSVTGTGIASGVPVCTLTATPTKVTKDRTATLTASCNPAATSFSWTGGTCAGGTASSCVVTPAATTSYSVTGTNGSGAGLAASATVTVTIKPVDLTPILMLLLD